MMRTWGWGVALLVGLGCKVQNAEHCGNRSGDATCRQRGDALVYCSICAAAHDGCVADPVQDPACRAGSDTAGGSGGSSSGSSTVASGSSRGAGSTSTAGGSGSVGTASETSGAESSAGSTSSEPTTSTTGPGCGDGVIEGDEQCDGDALAGQTCAAMAEYAGGTLACKGDCTLDTSGCTPCQPSTKGCATDDECCSGSCNGTIGLCS